MKKEKVMFGQRSADRLTGQIGSVVVARVGAKYPKAYRFDSHGMSAAEVADMIRALEVRQVEKEARVDAMQALVGRDVVVDTHRFRISAVTIRERGADTELVLNLARWDGAEWVRMREMPVRRVVATIEKVPDDATIEAIARDVAERWVQKEQEQEEFAAEVSRLLGG